MSNKYNILYKSHYPWSKIASRYTSLAIALSQSGGVENIVFLDPLRNISNIGRIRKKIESLSRIGRYKQLIDAPFPIYSAVSPIPFIQKSRFAKKIHDLWCESTFKKIATFVPKDNRICLLQGPSEYTFAMLKALKKYGFTIIFDWGDLYEEHAGSKSEQEKIARICREIASNADIVLGISPTVTEIAKSYNKNSFTFLDAALAEMIPKIVPPPRYSKEVRLKKPNIGYFGLINQVKLDYPLIKDIAAQKPDWTFTFIGPQVDPIGDGEKLEGKNINIVPPMDTYSLHKYLIENIDLCFIPYNADNKANRACSPLKLYEGLGDGLPVVAVDSFDPVDSKSLISIAKTSSELISALEYELETDSLEKRQRRIEYARNNTWEARAEQLIDILDSVLYPNMEC